MKINRIKTLLIFVAIALAGLTFASCSHDDLNTDQYTGTKMNVYGPNPVARGGQLRFLGSNMNDVVKITIPGSGDVTDLKHVSDKEVDVTVPQNAEVGYVTLTFKDGTKQISKTQLTYSEPISIASISPETVNPGDVITIKGEYLNLIHAVIFSNNISIGDSAFIVHSRNEIQIAVPETAQSGPVILSDEKGDLPQWIYSQKDLVVNLPTVTGLSPTTILPGSKLTINGTHLDWVKSVTVGGVATTDFSVAKDVASMTVTVPVNAPSGEVTLVAKSGVSVDAGKIETLNPSDLKVSPDPVKNGAVLTITGKNLINVTGATFPHSDMVSPGGVTANSVTFTVPSTAQAGDITLVQSNGSKVTVAYSLVAPTVSSFVPASVPQGTTLTVNGTDLDLVDQVTFTGMAVPTAISQQSATSFQVLVPSGALSGKMTLNLKNGTSLETPVITVTEPLVPTVTGAGATANPGGMLTITGAHLDEAGEFFLGDYGLVTEKTAAGSAQVKIPADIPYGTYTIKFINKDGNLETSNVQVAVTSPEYTVFDTPTTISGWGDPRIHLDRTTPTDLSKLTIVPGVSKMMVYYDAPAWFDLQFNDAGWNSYGEVKADASSTLTDGAAPIGNNQKVAITITAAMLKAWNVQDGWSNYFTIIQGDGGVTVNKITILP